MPDFIINSSVFSHPGAATLTQVGGGKTLTTIATAPNNSIPVSGRFSVITGAGIATCTIASGSVDGQEVTVLNLGAACTITAAAGGVAANVALASLASHKLSWEATTSLWYQLT